MQSKYICAFLKLSEPKSGNLVFVKCEQSKNVNSTREFEYKNVKMFFKTLFLIKGCEAIGKFSQMV